MALLIEQFSSYRGRLEAAVARTRGMDLDQVKLRPPLPRPANIVCMAVNYDDGLISSRAYERLPQSIIGDHRSWRHHGSTGCAGQRCSKARPS